MQRLIIRRAGPDNRRALAFRKGANPFQRHLESGTHHRSLPDRLDHTGDRDLPFPGRPLGVLELISKTLPSPEPDLRSAGCPRNLAVATAMPAISRLASEPNPQLWLGPGF